MVKFKKYFHYSHMALIFFIWLLCLMSSPVFAGDKKLKKIGVVATGGTISEKIDPKTGASMPTVSGDDLLKSVPGLSEIVTVKVVQVSQIDSKDMNYETMIKIAKATEELNQDDSIDGIVIIHGTDTMEDTGFFLNHVITPKKPIVMTGSMLLASDFNPDGPRNLLEAVQVAVDLAGKPQKFYASIMVLIQGNIFNAEFVNKIDTTNIAAFSGGDAGKLGYLTQGKTQLLNLSWAPKRLNIPEKPEKIDVIFSHPGSNGSMIKQAIEEDKANGIVLVGYGEGNINEPSYKALKQALKKSPNTLVMIVSRTRGGSLAMGYGGPGGTTSLGSEGFIMGYNYAPAKAAILLVLFLENGYSAKDANAYISKEPV